MTDRDEIVARILAECENDHVGLWELVNAVRLDLGIHDPAEVRTVTLELVRALLEQPRMEAGFPTPDGRQFASWGLSPDEAVTVIRQRWDALGRAPSVGEIAWLNRGDRT